MEVIFNKRNSHLWIKGMPRASDLLFWHLSLALSRTALQIGSYTRVGVICVKQLERGQRIGASYFKLQSHFLSGLICLLRWIPIASVEQREQAGRSRGPVLRFGQPDDSHREKHLSHIKVGGRWRRCNIWHQSLSAIWEVCCVGGLWWWREDKRREPTSSPE